MLVTARKYKGNISKEKNDDWDKLVLSYKYNDISIEVIIDNDRFTVCNFTYSGVVFYKGIMWFKDIESLSKLLKMISRYFQDNIKEYIG